MLFARRVLSSDVGLSFLHAYLFWSRTRDGNEAPQRGHMSVGYTSDKDEFSGYWIQDSKYLPLPAKEPAKVQLHSITSKQLPLTIYSDSLSEHHKAALKKMGLKSIPIFLLHFLKQ